VAGRKRITDAESHAHIDIRPRIPPNIPPSDTYSGHFIKFLFIEALTQYGDKRLVTLGLIARS
jgi:hypothetical protein